MPEAHTESVEVWMSALGAGLSRQRLRSNWTQAELAREAGVSKRTVERLEAGSSVQLSSLYRVLSALGLGGSLAALVPDAVPTPMEQLERRQGSGRQRASSPRSPSQPDPGWSWDDDS